MLLVDARGAPRSIIGTGANRHDVTQLTATLDRGGCPFLVQPFPKTPGSL